MYCINLNIGWYSLRFALSEVNIFATIIITAIMQLICLLWRFFISQILGPWIRFNSKITQKASIKYFTVPWCTLPPVFGASLVPPLNSFSLLSSVVVVDLHSIAFHTYLLNLKQCNATTERDNLCDFYDDDAFNALCVLEHLDHMTDGWTGLFRMADWSCNEFILFSVAFANRLFDSIDALFPVRGLMWS